MVKFLYSKKFSDLDVNNKWSFEVYSFTPEDGQDNMFLADPKTTGDTCSYVTCPVSLAGKGKFTKLLEKIPAFYLVINNFLLF